MGCWITVWNNDIELWWGSLGWLWMKMTSQALKFHGGFQLWWNLADYFFCGEYLEGQLLNCSKIQKHLFLCCNHVTLLKQYLNTYLIVILISSASTSLWIMLYAAWVHRTIPLEITSSLEVLDMVPLFLVSKGCPASTPKCHNFLITVRQREDTGHVLQIFQRGNE